MGNPVRGSAEESSPREGVSSPGSERATLGLAWVLLSGCHPVLKLLGRVSPQELWRADLDALQAWGLSSASASRFVEARLSFRVDVALAVMRKTGVGFVGYGSPFYPEELTHLSYPPAGLFYKGHPEALSALSRLPRITVVGTRRATAYGLRATTAFARAFAEAGVAVISGLALGIDGQAHQAALEVGGLTVAVLGCGVDVVYPKRHWRLYAKVAEEGLLVSELPPGILPTRWTFPQRNRLLAALGDAVLVAEGSRTSGAMQTAAEAACLGRTVFAVPGPFDVENHNGCNRLLYDGAVPALVPHETVQEFLAETRIARAGRDCWASWRGLRGGVGGSSHPALEKERLQRASLEASEQTGDSSDSATGGFDRAAVLEELAAGPRSIDDLVARTGLTARRVAVLLAKLEVNGKIVQVGPGLYIRPP